MTTDLNNTSAPLVNWYDAFSPEQRKVLVFLVAYERERKKSQFGYQAWKVEDESVLRLPVFKQGATVVAWLESQGKSLTWTDKDWQGYVVYAFKHFNPRVPFVGQLKNRKIFRLYRINGFKLKLDPVMSRSELAERYKAFLRPELKNDAGLRLMGL